MPTLLRLPVVYLGVALHVDEQHGSVQVIANRRGMGNGTEGIPTT